MLQIKKKLVQKDYTYTADKTHITNSVAPHWRALEEEKGLGINMDVALLLLDRLAFVKYFE